MPSMTRRSAATGTDTDTASVTLEVQPINDAPKATDAEFQIAENTASGVSLGNVTAVDVDDTEEEEARTVVVDPHKVLTEESLQEMLPLE